MKKSLSQAIAVATLLGAAATAQAAVQVNHEGVGSALLYPLYSVENGNSTLVSVVNTTGKAKAVKIRFVEAMNSAEVLDFHLYLSPQDTWSGAIVPTEDGGAKLVSGDTSCIAGQPGGFPAAGLPFRDDQIRADINAARTDAGYPQKVDGANSSISRVRVGHFEVIEMGEINPATASVFDADGQVAAVSGKPAILLEKAITHIVKDGKRVPASCAAITNEWSHASGQWNAVFTGGNDMVPAVTGLTKPMGGLYGTAAIVNVPQSWASSYDAVAIWDNTVGDNGLFKAPQHPRPGSIYPNLATDTVVGNNTGVMDDAALKAVSDALAVKSVYNDYYVDPDFGAETDLVLSFPTKRFYVNRHPAAAGLTGLTWVRTPVDAAGNQPSLTVAGDIVLTGGPNAPYGVATYFKHAWNANTNKACEYLQSPVVYDKEEGKEVVEDGFISPRPVITSSLPLCYETNVVSINNSNSFGADLVRTSVKTPFLGGWIDLEAGANYTSGLPVIGFANVVTKNGADSVLRNFAQSFKHKTAK